MIPLELRVRNFMCYRDVPPLSFEGIHLACLTGANGHGKSALLDAMTWALWGKARAKRDDELIHQGESEMEVELRFDLGGRVYRVVRKRDSAKAGRTLLDLQVQDEDRFRSIAEPTVRSTQAAITRLLRMDYETFTNSAFLLQGRADAFTMRTPAERKQILAEILGLGAWDEYEQRAKDGARELERQVAEVEGLLREIERELSRRPQYEAERAEAEDRVAALSTAVKAAEGVQRDLRQEHQALVHQQARLHDLERRLAQAERELGEIAAQAAGREKRLAQYEQVMAQRQQVEDGYAALLAARQAEDAWNQRLDQFVKAQGHQRELERAVDAARGQLEQQIAGLGERCRDLERRSGEAPATEQHLADARSRLAYLACRQVDRETALATRQALTAEAAVLNVHNEQLRTSMDSLRDKIDLLQREAGAACPLCGQALTDDHRDQLIAQFGQEGTALANAHRANTARGREIAAETKRLEGELQALDRELSALPAQQRREAQLEQGLVQAREAADGLVQAQAELAALVGRLRAADYALAEHQELARLSADLQALGYDAEAHQQARAQTASLAHFEELHRSLSIALERVGDERTALEDLRSRHSRWQATVLEDRTQRASLAAQVARLPELAERLRAHGAELDELQSQSTKARLGLGAAQQRLAHCDYLQEERERRTADRRRLAEQRSLLDELRLAFGKKGIQAMIIEAVIPEIEFEANRLLSRMTAGRMHVRLETQRETLTGEVQETLDINIADELGTRPYELFSGGEAFRVNLAIRIALSRLLAHRAGAQLQLLVIDEGFGTQDAEGRERLVEAINSIQDDFARILVVTHIEDLRDAFPVRIEVIKTPNGSQISLN